MVKMSPSSGLWRSIYHWNARRSSVSFLMKLNMLRWLEAKAVEIFFRSSAAMGWMGRSPVRTSSSTRAALATALLEVGISPFR